MSFEKWTQLLDHKKTSSICAPKFKCKECDKEFKYHNVLRDHEEIHKPKDERKGFQCSYEGCDKFYTMKKNLDSHFRRKHGDQKEAFKCTYDDCGQILSTKKKLQDHIRVKHTHVQVHVRKAGPRNQRKDAGKKKRILEDLTGLDIPNDVEKEILHKGGDVEVVDVSD